MEKNTICEQCRGELQAEHLCASCSWQDAQDKEEEE